MSPVRISFLASVRSFWPYYLCAWLFFPALVFAVRFLGIELSDWWVAVVLLSFIAGIVPWVPWFRRRIGYWPNAFWAIAVPFITLLFAVTVASAMDAA